MKFQTENRIGTQREIIPKHVRKLYYFSIPIDSCWLGMAKIGVGATQIIETCLCANQTINCINWAEREMNEASERKSGRNREEEKKGAAMVEYNLLTNFGT